MDFTHTREWFRTEWDYLRSSYWFIPSVMAIGAVVLALTTVRLDEYYRDDALREQGWVYSGGPAGARAVLSTIAGSIITVAGTTFSITIAVLSLASAQFGPRLLRNFMRDTGNQVVLGTFTSTFLYCLLVLRTVRGLEDNTYVPHISVTVGVVLAVSSLGVLIYFIHHIAESIQVGHIIEMVSEELRDAVNRIFPERLTEAGAATEEQIEWQCILAASKDGYLQAINEQALLRLTHDAGCVVKLLCRPGDYVVDGMPLLTTSESLDDKQLGDFRNAFTFGRERTPHQDVAFAFLQIAEVAIRALSPGVNDPFTAIMCIDRITSGMAQLTGRSMPQPVRCDDSGAVRVVAYAYSYDDLVEAGYGHIREAAKDQPYVLDHLRAQFHYLWELADNPQFRTAIARELARSRMRDPGQA